jgi:hypothetical protein
MRTLEEHAGVAVVPNANLVTNVGFGQQATHTTTLERYAMLPATVMEFPLSHPPQIAIDGAADNFARYVHFKNIRHINLLWAYMLADIVVGLLKAIKRRLMASSSSSTTKPASTVKSENLGH